jgi:hypothetical protein
MADVLSDRALSRATLCRQGLLARVDRPALDMIIHLAGMQGQDAELPYVGLWNRIIGFTLDDLSRLLHDRQVVRATLFRGTQHLLATDDYLWIRPLLQPMLDSRGRGAFGRHIAGIDPADLAEAAAALLRNGTLTRPQLGRALAARWPDRIPQWLASSTQMLLPVVHPPPAGLWGRRGPTPFVLAETYLKRPLAAGSVDDLVLRYLAAFGPASVMDMQAWSGMTRLRDAFERVRPRLRIFRSESGAELFDLPDAPRPDAETPAPVRFLPTFDNVLYGHAERGRIIAAEHRRYLLAHAMVTVDGVARARWRIKAGTLTIHPLRPFTVAQKAAVEAEAATLLAFAAGTATPDLHWAIGG